MKKQAGDRPAPVQTPTRMTPKPPAAVRTKFRLRVSPHAGLFLALLYFYDRQGLVLALLPAVLSHELGHVCALLLGGGRLRGIRVELFGLELDYAGTLPRTQTLLALAAGPLGGLLYAAAAWAAGTPFFRRGALLSLLLSLYNLLPILPLDGGRLLEELLGRIWAERVSRWAACCFLAAGLWALRSYRVLFPFLAALWLLFRNFFDASVR